ncbi:MAG: bi-domain-containing oxidoreductase [Lentisphaeria bacterium]|jgi:polar amino acid transport system substrate-binding protein|nr:bi-domain-containing oxidoreductase [Lentisphaeria bacterium]
MKQVVQNYRKGTLALEDVPVPVNRPGGVLVQTHFSLISAGTEKMKVDDAKRSYVGMAKARPDKVKQVMETFRQLGPLATFRKVMNRLDSMTPLGYSLAGRVIDVGRGVTGFQVGDMVACGGGELATHAEINWIPVNLCVKIPELSGRPGELLPAQQAAFATVGSIAMQGVRQAAVQVGENVAVIGLGLVGLLACQILKAAGCRVLGFDIDQRKVDLARQLGVDAAENSGQVDPIQVAESFSGGYGADAVLVTTGTRSNEPIVTAGRIARDRATIVDVGINRMDVPWDLYYAKELVLKQSRSYGPGRYDPAYEMHGHDYPIGYVRWTENRNMQSFLELQASGKLDVGALTTHVFDFDRAAEAYDLIAGQSGEFYVGIVLKYETGEERLRAARIASIRLAATPAEGAVNLGVIGAGNFARTMLLPHLKGAGVNLAGVAAATGISARDTARKFGFDTCTTDYTELLADEGIDAVLVATRHDLHGRVVREALQAGKHVYTEKPLCLNEAELAEIAAVYAEAAAGARPPILTVGFNRRYAPLVRRMKDFFAGRQEPMVLHYRCNAGFMEKNSWYQDLAVGGGRIIGEVCHFIDTLQYLTGSDPVRVYARSIRTDNQATTPADNVVITLAFGDGSVASVTYLANGDPSFPKEYLEAFADRKVAVLDNFSRLTTMARGRRKVVKSALQDKGHKAEMQALAETLKGSRETPIPFASLYATTLATFKVHESLEKGTEIEIHPCG